MTKKTGEYPDKRDDQIINKHTLTTSNKSLLLTTYESNKSINIYIGGRTTWCIHCELIKLNTSINSIGYLIKLRYDNVCSLDNTFNRGHDTKQLIFYLIQYIYNNYPAVKELTFNDLSTKTCDNNDEVSLAIMTYLYMEKTWYEKNFGAYISNYSSNELDKIKTKYSKAKEIEWDIMKETIINNELSQLTDVELEKLYTTTKTWKDFFQTIYKRIDIGDFCMFISPWISGFILKYFNNLQGLTYMMPVKNYNLKYLITEYTGQNGGRRFTEKKKRKSSK